MKERGGRDGGGGGGGGGVHERAEDAAGGGRDPLRDMNSGDGYAAPTPRATGLRPRAPAGRQRAPRVLERRRDAEDLPREREASSEEEAKELAVRPGGDSAFYHLGHRSAATAKALEGRGRRERRNHAVNYPRDDDDDDDDESPSEAAALIVRARGARQEFPEGGGDSASYETGLRSTAKPLDTLGWRSRRERRYYAVSYPHDDEYEAGALVVRPRARRECRPERGRTALGGSTPFRNHHDAVEWPRESEPPSRDRRARGAPPERCGWTSDTVAAGQRRPATAYLAHHHHGGLVSPREPEARRAEGRPRGLHLEDSGKGREKSVDLPRRCTPVQGKPFPDMIDARGGLKRSTAAAVQDENGALTAQLKASSEPESSNATASGHPLLAQGETNIGMQVEAVDNPQNSELIQSIITDLLGNKDALNVEFLENWLLEKERDSTAVYFETYASHCERIWYNKWASCLTEYIRDSTVVSHQNYFSNSYCDEISEADLDAMFRKTQHQRYKCRMEDLLKGSCEAMYCLQEFLHRSCLNPDPKLEFTALSIILAAANSKNNVQILGEKIRIIGIAVLKAFIGSPHVQIQALRLLVKLCSVHKNTKKILDFGGFCCAIHVLKFSALGAEPAAHLLSRLLESECSYPNIFKDHLPYYLVKAVGLGRVQDTNTIEDILLVSSKVELAQTQFFDALVILKSGSRTKNFLFAILSRIASQEED